MNRVFIALAVLLALCGVASAQGFSGPRTAVVNEGGTTLFGASAGAIRGVYVSTTVAPTVQAAAYGIGNNIGGLLTFTSVIPNANAGGLVEAATAKFASGVVPSLDLIVFNANPSGSTITDKVAIAVATADLPKVVGVIHISDCTLLAATTESVCQAQNTAMIFGVTAATTLYGALVARSAVTLGSTTDATVEIKVLQ